MARVGPQRLRKRRNNDMLRSIVSIQGAAKLGSIGKRFLKSGLIA